MGRFIGFVAFVGPAMAIFAALVLLPMYKHLQMSEYKLACKEARTQEQQQFVDCRKRVTHDMTEDPVLAQRLLMSQSPLLPADATVVDDPTWGKWSPMMIEPVKVPLPDPPQAKWKILGVRVDVLELATRLENPTTKRGLVLMMIGAVIAGVFLFGPHSSQKPSK